MNDIRNDTNLVKIKKPKRKPRTIKNAYIDISNVTEEPGDGYVAWIAITKQKLKQRELKLIEIRKNRIEDIVGTILNKNDNENIIPSQFIEYVLDKLYNLIDTWNGVRISSKRLKIRKSFKTYFGAGKNWWDQKKRIVFGPIFWCRIFNEIESNLHDFNHKISFQHSMYLILKELLTSTVKYSNTKHQPLVPIGTIKNCKYIKEYLLKLHFTLTIDEWIKNDIEMQQIKDKRTQRSNTYTANAKLIVQQLKSQLNMLISNEETANKIETKTSQYREPNVSTPVFASVPLFPVVYNLVPIVTNVPIIHPYNGFHTQTQLISNQRFNPLQSQHPQNLTHTILFNQIPL
eukprot:277235_1